MLEVPDLGTRLLWGRHNGSMKDYLCLICVTIFDITYNIIFQKYVTVYIGPYAKIFFFILVILDKHCPKICQ